MKPANGQLTTVAWLRSLAGLAGVGVSTQLPTDVESWAETGFITVTTDVGGSSHRYVPWRQTPMQLDCYGVAPNTRFPDWAKANELAEIVVNAAYDNESLNTPLALRTGWRMARVTSVYPLSEPGQAYDDPASYGHFQVDLMINWVEIPE